MRHEGLQKKFAFPEVANIVNYWIRGDLSKMERNFQWCPPNFFTRSDQAPISYQVLEEEYMDYKFVGLPATATKAEATYDPGESPFIDVLAANLSAWMTKFPYFLEGLIESSIQLLSLEIQVNKLG